MAITTASGLLVPVILQHPELSQHHIALIIVAIGCGSLFLSHLNDSGFWIVKDCLGLTVGQTLRNANYNVRSEFPNPQLKVSPWLQSTIDPDVGRKPLEIGAGW